MANDVTKQLGNPQSTVAIEQVAKLRATQQ